MPTLHLNTFNDVLDSAFITLFRTQYDVVTELNSTSSKALYPALQLRVSLIENNWTETTILNGLKQPAKLPFMTMEQNVTLSRAFTLDVDISAFLNAFKSLQVVSFSIEIVSDPANLQMHSRAHPENEPPILTISTAYPNLVLSQSATTFTSIANRLYATDGDRTTSTDAISSWIQVNLPSMVPSGTLAIFFPLSQRNATLQVIVSTQAIDPSFDLTAAKATATAYRTFTISRPVLLWPVHSATQYIRLYCDGIPISEVEFYGPGITLSVTDDGKGIRSTNHLMETMISQFPRQSWTLGSGTYIAEDNLASGMPTNQSSVSKPSTTTFELNPWWSVDLGSVQAIGDVLISLGRTMDEIAACRNPSMPVDSSKLTSFTRVSWTKFRV